MAAGWDPDVDPAKSDYAVERVQLNGWPEGIFSDDRADQGADPIGFHINGICPSCAHRSTALCAARYIDADGAELADAATAQRQLRESYAAGAVERGDVISQVTVLRCACVHQHDNAPSGAFGCGTEWLLRVAYPRNHPHAASSYSPVTESESFHYWAPADSVTSTAANSLTSAQTLAGRWLTVLTGFLTVVGFSLTVAGRDTIQAWGAGWQIGFASAAAVAIGCDVAILYFGNMAQYGFPRLTRALTRQNLRDADIDPLREAEASVSKLKISFWLSIVTVSAAIVAVGVFLYAPARHSPPSQTSYKVSVKVDTSAAIETTGCGSIKLDTSGSPPTVTFTPDSPEKLSVVGGNAERPQGGGARVFALRDVQSIDAC